jgi:hypothetical protein
MEGVNQTASSIDRLNTLIRNQEQKFNESTRILRATNEQLKKKRGPVQPRGELAKEQSRIRNIVEKNALFIQVVLFLVFLCVVAYLMLPSGIANYTALAILSVAVIYRIFFVQ